MKDVYWRRSLLDSSNWHHSRSTGLTNSMDSIQPCNSTTKGITIHFITMIRHWQYHGAHSWLFDERAIRDSCQRQILSIDLKEGLVSQVKRKDRKKGGIGDRGTVGSGAELQQVINQLATRGRKQRTSEVTRDLRKGVLKRETRYTSTSQYVCGYY